MENGSIRPSRCQDKQIGTNILKTSLKSLYFNFIAPLYLKREVNRCMQIRRSMLVFGPIRRSDIIFVQIRIRIT